MIKNLARDKKIEISSFVPTEHTFSYEEKGKKDMLTDGNIGDPSDRFGGEWAHFAYGLGRTLFVDLGSIYAVSGFDIGFLHDSSANASCPEKVRLLLSENGFDYYNVLTVDSPYPAAFSMQARASYRGELDVPLCARYVKVVFGVEVNAFCDELRIFGSECGGFEQHLSGDAYIISDKNSYASRDSLGGTYDLPIIYFGKNASETHRISREEFLPYLAYIDKNGKIADTMFDSVLLVPNRLAPSGGVFYQTGGFTDMSDWEWLMDELFAPECNLKALDAAVADVKSVLGLDKGYKHKVYLTAPVPKVSLKPFGDINGGGIIGKLITTDDCVSAYCRFVDNLTRRFNAQCFQNIQLEGWMWNSTLSRTHREDEAQFAEKCVSELHKRGYKCVYTPFNQGANIYRSDEVGFDCVTMEHGTTYCAELQADMSGAFEDVAATCKKYGFGIQLDMHRAVTEQENNDEYVRLFEQSLRECMHNGMMTQTVHTYLVPVYECICSPKRSVRAVYDKLYKFIKGYLSEWDFENDGENADSYDDSHRADLDAPVTLPELSEEMPLPESFDAEPDADADADEVLEVSEELLDEILGFISDDALESEADEVEVEDEVFEETAQETEDISFEPVQAEIFKDDSEPEPKRSVNSDLAVEVAVSVEIKGADASTKTESVVTETVGTEKQTPETEPIPESEPETAKHTQTPRKRNCKKSHLACAAGVAAVLGVAYIIKKLTDDK